MNNKLLMVNNVANGFMLSFLYSYHERYHSSRI